MSKLFESGALDLLKDIASGNDHGVIPSDIAPDVTQNNLIAGVPYSANNDPEVNGESSSSATAAPTLEESVEARRRTFRLEEGKNDEILNFLQSTGDGSFEAFQNSESYSKANNRDGSQCDLSDYVRAVNFLVAGGKISPDELPEGTPRSTRAAKAASSNAYDAGDADDSENVYKRGEDFDADGERSELYNRWVSSYENESAVTSAEETFEDMAAIVKEIITGVADKRHACIAGDPGIGKTYLVRKVAEQYIGDSGKRLFYSSGAMSPSLTSVVPFFFFHKDNEVIILDDNDRIIMKSCDQNTQNFMKAVLDPSALKKPISVPTTMLKQFQQQLDTISGLNESAIKIDIDTEALREQRFIMKVNGEVAMNEYITESEAREFSNMFAASKSLREASDMDDFFDEDMDSPDVGDMADDMLENHLVMEPSFIFNSSVIFISNLKLAEISPAVADRCENCEVTLTLTQFMDRLESILGGLCQGEEYSSRPQYIRDWSKENIFVMLQGLVEAFNSNATLFGTKISIRRKFTFRMFEEFANFWARQATLVAEKNGLNLEKDKDRHVVGKEIEKFVLKKMIKWVNQKAAKEK